MPDQEESHLRVYADRSVLLFADGKTQTFVEGHPNAAAQARQTLIEMAFKSGYLDNLIKQLRNQTITPKPIEPEHLKLIEDLVGAVTSEVGRGLIGLTVLLLSIKDIVPEQSVRLHKGGRREFSWRDGVSMRTLDKKYITPVLRHHELLRMNRDGVMMTRTLAENYPYSTFYKAAIRGAKQECFMLIELVESGEVKSRPLLEALISILINQSQRFQELGDQTLSAVVEFLRYNPTSSEMRSIIVGHMTHSTYSARLLEIAMHSLFQVLDSHGTLPGHLEPLSQMRSANKKHGNVADIEVVQEALMSQSYVIEAWDAKYGKTYLRDELDELSDKLEEHPETIDVGFVVDREPEIDSEVATRIEDLEFMHDVTVRILSLDDWIDQQVSRTNLAEHTVYCEWLTAYAESLSLRRRNIAPIDEPADQWLEDLLELL